MSFLIRAYAPSDLPTLHAIRNAAFAPVFASFRSIVGPEIAALGLATAEQEQGDLLDAIARPDSGHTLAVAETNDAIAGFVSWKTDAATKIGEITLNAVHPGHGGKGIGTALYEHALAAPTRRPASASICRRSTCTGSSDGRTPLTAAPRPPIRLVGQSTGATP